MGMTDILEFPPDKQDLLSEYCHKHGHYPTIQVANGSDQTVEIVIASGYLRISTFPYGSHLHITASAFREMMQRAQPLIDLQGKDFDVPAAIASYIRAEDQHKIRKQARKAEERRAAKNSTQAERAARARERVEQHGNRWERDQ